MESKLLYLFYYQAIQSIKELEKSNLYPDYVGIRPKIKTTDGKFSGFYITHEKEKGFPGWTNLIGIDSPGLTARIAICKDMFNAIHKD